VGDWAVPFKHTAHCKNWTVSRGQSFKRGHHALKNFADDFSAYLGDDKLVRWYGENCNCVPRSEKLRAVPLGLENRYWKTDGEFAHLLKRARGAAPLDQRRFLLYVNIGLHSNPDRARKVKHFRELGIAHVVQEKRSFIEYVDDLADSKFVLSPFGNGVDCHRTWEVRFCQCSR
jgi:hypothetical protein